MNLVSQGQQNVIINGNPSKTFWKAKYAKHTNFGLQKFRIDYEGSKQLNMSEESTFSFKVPRYGDLLMDSYVSVNLPHIWSPILPPQIVTDSITGEQIYTDWAPYEFKWIDNLGAQMIKKITITCGNSTIQEYSGKYILCSVNRDFSQTKKNLFNEMIGNLPELNDPGNAGSRVNVYPNSFFLDSDVGPQPSIKGRVLYIPINSWFQLKTQMSFPLVSLQYNELNINITFRPIQELYRIRDVSDYIHNFPYISPNANNYLFQMNRFLQPPPEVDISSINSYIDKRNVWDPNIHIVSTYCFLSTDEQKLFAQSEQKYLFKQITEKQFDNVTGSKKVNTESLGLISSWMWYFQRSDVNSRNEWSNYSNWPYNYEPKGLMLAPTSGLYDIDTSVSSNMLSNCSTLKMKELPTSIGPGVNANGNLTQLMISDEYSTINEKNILINLGILLDGQYRENLQPVGVYDYIEKYTRTPGNGESGIYCYNFCLNTSPYELQPSGAINMSRFSQVELEFNTIIPPVDPLAQSLSICDPETGDVVGVNKSSWELFDYNYNLTLFEERINIVTFVAGNASLMYAT